MTTCTFLCDSPIIDTLFPANLRQAVNDLAGAHDAIEFIFPDQSDSCAALCLCAVLEAQQAHPHHRITITTLEAQWAADGSRDTDQYFTCFPDCVVDRAVKFDGFSDSDADRSRYWLNRRRVLFRLFDRVDYILSYNYTDISSDIQFYLRAKRAKATMIDLTEQSTAQAIRETVFELPPEKQWLLRQRADGVTSSELARQCDRSSEAIRQRFARITNLLRFKAMRRYTRLLSQISQLSICSICCIQLGAAIPEAQISNYRYIVGYLLQHMNSIRFIVHVKHIDAEPTKILLEEAKDYGCTEISPLDDAIPEYYFRDGILECCYAGERKWRQTLTNADTLVYASGQDAEANEIAALRGVSRLKLFDLSRPEPEIIDLTDEGK